MHMNITIEYHGQLRHLANRDTETCTVQPGTSIPDIVTTMAHNHDDAFRAILLDEDGNLLHSTLMFIGDETLDRANWPTLKDGDIITLLPPIAGG